MQTNVTREARCLPESCVNKVLKRPNKFPGNISVSVKNNKEKKKRKEARKIKVVFGHVHKFKHFYGFSLWIRIIKFSAHNKRYFRTLIDLLTISEHLFPWIYISRKLNHLLFICQYITDARICWIIHKANWLVLNYMNKSDNLIFVLIH